MTFYLNSKQKGNKGEALVESFLSEYAIVHRIDGSKDVGIDMICEWVNGEKPTQLMFAIQVKSLNIRLELKSKKSRLNFLEEYRGSITIKQATLEYWKGFDFPVFVFLVDLKKLKIYYKRYTSVVHGLINHTKEPFYLVMEDNEFHAYVEGEKHTWGFCRDLFFDHLRCQHNKGMLSGIDPSNLGLRGWSKEALYEGVFDQYKDKIRATYNKYQKWNKYF
ncbi:MAG: DUF4365 domain-containing protein [Candidatus Levybacteria bacterium]|nr:DUF4365 domain-containing protein [Candidatus Levybacteria bacterium]